MKKSTSQYLPDALELPRINPSWKEMQWGKQDNKEKKQNNVVIITSTKSFLAGDQRMDYEAQLKEEQVRLQELKLSLQDPGISHEDQIIIQQEIQVQRKAVNSLKLLIQEFSEKGKDYKEYIEYCAYAKAQLYIAVSYTENIDSLWKKQLEKAAENLPDQPTMKKTDIGDQGKIAVTNTYASLFFIKGNFLVSVQAVTRPELAEKVGRIIESKLGMILLVAPVQVLYQDVPCISGKKMGVFVAVKGKGTAKNTLSLKVSKGRFLRNEYVIPLNASTPVEFDSVPQVDDGGTWEKEVAEPVKDNEIQQCRKYFNITEKNVKFFRFCLKPINPDYNGHYWFRADIIDDKNRKLASVSAGKRTVPSPSVTVAVVPVKVGYWAHPKEWLDKAIEIEGNIPREFPQNHLYVWTDLIYTQFMESLTEKEKKKVTPIKRWLKRAFQSGEGERAYTETAKRMVSFTKGIFPFAEEKITFKIFKGDEKECDMNIDPDESSLETIAETLDKWAKTHGYQKVVGIVPGYKKGMGGCNFDLEGIGVYIWWYGKNAVVVALQAPAHTGPHELAHTYGAVDEYLSWGKLNSIAQRMQIAIRMQKILNTPRGKDSGEKVKTGYWAAKKKFMGTPHSPKDSIMGKAVDNPSGWLISSVENLAWIGPTLYRGMVTMFHPWLEE